MNEYKKGAIVRFVRNTTFFSYGIDSHKRAAINPGDILEVRIDKGITVLVRLSTGKEILILSAWIKLIHTQCLFGGGI